MNFSSQNTPKNSHIQSNYQQDISLDLFEYIKILWTRKIGVLIVIILFVLAAVIINLLATPTYESRSVVSIGKSNGQKITTLNETQSFFEFYSSLKQIQQKLNYPATMPLSAIKAKFDITNKLASVFSENFIVIRGRDDSPEKAKAIVIAVEEILLENHKIRLEDAQKNYELEIKKIKNNQSDLEQAIKLGEESLKKIDEDIAWYKNEIFKRSNVQSEGQGRIVESYINQLADIKLQKENKLSSINSSKTALKNIQVAISQIELKNKYDSVPTKIESEPILPQTKIAPERTKNVKIAIILAVFAGILYAFAAEFIIKHKAELKKSLEKLPDDATNNFTADLN